MSRLSRYGKLIRIVEGNPEPKETAKFDWADAVLDAGIFSAITFFTTIAGTSTVGLQGEKGIIAGGIAAALQFFTILAIKRKLIREE